jgi:FAD/FMN-containing dehydrogenase
MKMDHSERISLLQQRIRSIRNSESGSHAALYYSKGQSNTTRSKSYKNVCHQLDCSSLNHILQIDTQRRIAIVEPRVNMEDLVKATLSHGLIAPVIPEFKGITVGGAIMGSAAESSSHHWGTFNDICNSYEILCGDGTLLKVSPDIHPEIFYGIPGSYGSLGMLVSAEIKLIPAEGFVHVQYHSFQDPQKALQVMQEMAHQEIVPDFLDGIIFSNDFAVIMEGHFHTKTSNSPERAPLDSRISPWYYQHVQKANREEEIIPLYDYLFRYDQGAFWMGSYVSHLPLFTRFLAQGILKISSSSQEYFTEKEIRQFHNLPPPNFFTRLLLHRTMSSQSLWAFLHKAEKWVQDRMMIQDWCIPLKNAVDFLNGALVDPGIFPIWLCPIKCTPHPQLFSPHLQSKAEDDYIINFGIYGIPSYSAPLKNITKKLELKTHQYKGRKVLYSRSYYSPDEFWEIYSKQHYEALRQQLNASGIWKDITDKVLSE